MPTMQNAHIDRALTNTSVAYMQDVPMVLSKPCVMR